MQEDRLWRQRHLEFMPALGYQRLGRLDCPLHDAAHADPLLAKPNTAGGDARDFQQVINQMFQLPDLTLYDAAALLLDWLYVLLETKQQHSVGEGGERVAQFMTKHRQKLVLAAVQVCQGLRLLQRLALQAAAFSDVVKATHSAGNLSLLILERNNIGNDGNS